MYLDSVGVKGERREPSPAVGVWKLKLLGDAVKLPSESEKRNLLAWPLMPSSVVSSCLGDRRVVLIDRGVSNGCRISLMQIQKKLLWCWSKVDWSANLSHSITASVCDQRRDLLDKISFTNAASSNHWDYSLCQRHRAWRREIGFRGLSLWERIFQPHANL